MHLSIDEALDYLLEDRESRIVKSLAKGEDSGPNNSDSREGDQCYLCNKYLKPGEGIPRKMDLDPGDPEVGPEPNIQDVFVCPECAKEEEEDEKSESPYADEQVPVHLTYMDAGEGRSVDVTVDVESKNGKEIAVVKFGESWLIECDVDELQDLLSKIEMRLIVGAKEIE